MESICFLNGVGLGWAPTPCTPHAPLPSCLCCSLPALMQARAGLARLNLDDATLLALLNRHIKALHGAEPGAAS